MPPTIAPSSPAAESVLQEWDERFDPKLNLIRIAVGPARYHTRLATGTPVHSTYASARYAAALLEASGQEREQRAAGMLARLVPLQDKGQESPFCGIWPWFYEESLAEMSPPDRNMADFIGGQIAQILWRNAGRVPVGLTEDLQESLRLAARAIKRRDIRLSYTNIAIMGTYVTVMAGTLLQDAELLAYGRDRLRRFVRFTDEYGGFPEYNSPDYTVIALTELSRMLRDFTDDEDLSLVRKVHDRAWEEIAIHWHGPSKQWAGPHCRSYSTMLTPEILSFIQCGLGGRAVIAESCVPWSLEQPSIPLRCPDELVPYFLEEAPRRDHTGGISEEKPVIEAHMHMRPEFVVSSVERGTFWNQARGLIAYAPSAGGSVALALRFLHDDYDFSAANLLCRQAGHRVLAGICLAYDRGDKHPELDRWPDRRIHAADWRLRIELFNLDPHAVPAEWTLGMSYIIPFGSDARLDLRFLFAQFGGFAPHFETGSDDGKCWIDLVFYKGPRREFHFDQTCSACAGLALALYAIDEIPTETAGQIAAAEKPAHWSLSDPARRLKLDVPKFPAREAEIVSFAQRQKSG